MSNFVNIIPNVKVMESLRCVGYSNDSAIADLVDNSIDAGASKIDIHFGEKKSDIKITIADNGCGMDKTILQEALKLGSETDRSSTDLGKFGVGLITASISIARRLQVLTKTEDGEVLSVVMDLDDMKVQGWKVPINKADDEALSLFYANVPTGCGTILVLSKCDGVSDTNVTQWADRLKKYLGRVFRLFLNENNANVLQINVNEQPVHVVDPLEWDYEGTEKEKEEISIEVKMPDGSSIDGKIKMRFAFLNRVNENRGKNAPWCLNTGKKYQGIYLIRNNREILAGHDLGMFEKDNWMNYCRIELRVGSEFDKAFGISFDKKQVNLVKSLSDQIVKAIKPWIVTCNKKQHKQAAAKSAPDVKKILEEAEQTIKNKPKGSLIMPKGTKFNRRGGEKNSKNVEVIESKNGHHNGSKPHEKKLADRCKFTTHAFGSGGCMFEATKEGRQIVISWNVDHPFYQEFIASTEETNAKKFILGIQYFAFALASAELTYSDDLDDGGASLLENVHNFMSMNMRTLLS